MRWEKKHTNGILLCLLCCNVSTQWMYNFRHFFFLISSSFASLRSANWNAKSHFPSIFTYAQKYQRFRIVWQRETCNENKRIKMKHEHKIWYKHRYREIRRIFSWIVVFPYTSNREKKRVFKGSHRRSEEEEEKNTRKNSNKNVQI